MVKYKRRIKTPEHKHELIDCIAYTEKEAREKKIKYVYWKDVMPDGKETHVLTDDGFIVKLRYCRLYKSASGYKSKYIDSEGGKLFASNCGVLHFQDNLNRDMWDISRKPYYIRALKRQDTKRLALVVAHFITSGKQFDWDYFLKIYNGSQDKKGWRRIALIKKIVRTKGVKDMINDNVRDILNAAGLTQSFAAETVKKAMEGALDKGEYKEVFNGAKIAGDWLGMGKKTVVEETKTIESATIKQIGNTVKEANVERITHNKEKKEI